MLIALAIALGLLAGLAVVIATRARSAPHVADQVRAATADALNQLLDTNRELRASDREAATAELAKGQAEIRRLTEPLASGLERIEREVAEFGKTSANAARATHPLIEQVRDG